MEQPSLFLRMHMAQYQLAAGNVDACKAAVSGAKDELDHLTDVRPPCFQWSCRTATSLLFHAPCLALMMFRILQGRRVWRHAQAELS